VSTPSHHHITRIDIAPDEEHPKRSETRGWLVRVRRQGERVSKFFSDKKHGGKEKALHDYAIPYRDELLATLPDPDDPVLRSAQARSQSGVIGLHFLYKDIGNGTQKPYIQLSWIDADDKRHSASYSIEKWGLRRAVWNGCLRLYKERPASRSPHNLEPQEMFKIAYPNIVKEYGPLPEREPEPRPKDEEEGEGDGAPAMPPIPTLQMSRA